MAPPRSAVRQAGMHSGQAPHSLTPRPPRRCPAMAARSLSPLLRFLAPRAVPPLPLPPPPHLGPHARRLQRPGRRRSRRRPRPQAHQHQHRLHHPARYRCLARSDNEARCYLQLEQARRRLAPRAGHAPPRPPSGRRGRGFLQGRTPAPPAARERRAGLLGWRASVERGQVARCVGWAGGWGQGGSYHGEEKVLWRRDFAAPHTLALPAPPASD
jgi:hypothetical protein